MTAIDLALKSHSKDICAEVLNFFGAKRNHTMLFVASMAFYGIVRADVIIEKAWKAGVYNDFVPFICQHISG